MVSGLVGGLLGGLIPGAAVSSPGSPLSSGGSSSQPTPPNYQALIGEQGATNYGQWLNQLYAGRPNQSNPYGFTQWSPPPMPGTGAGGATPTSGFATGMFSRPTSASAGTGGSGSGLFGGVIPAPTGQWGQQSGFSQPVSNVVNPALSGASESLGMFNPSMNPTFSPAQVGEGIYKGETALLEPQMQAQSQALDQTLKSEGYDVNQAGGAQTAENNLMNQQNLLRSSLAGQAIGMEIPQGAQALSAEQSQQTLPLQEAGTLLNTALAPAGLIPGGAAQSPGMAGVDVTGPAQQSYANQVGMYNAQQANQANFWNGLMGLGGSAALAFV